MSEETIVRLLNGEGAASGSWERPLQQWCDENADAWTFVPRIGAERKAAFLTALWSALEREAQRGEPNRRNSNGLRVLMLSVRLLLREAVAIDPVCSDEALGFFLRFARLENSGGEEQQRTSEVDASVSDEALKVVINLVSKHPPNRVRFVEGHSSHVPFVAMLRAASADSDAQKLFLLWRMAVQLTLDKPNAMKFRDVGTSAIAAADIAKCEHLIDDGRDVALPAYLSEALLTLFNLTVPIGPLAGASSVAPTEADADCFRTVVPFFDRVIRSRGGRLAPLRNTVCSCLVNSPRGWSTMIPEDMLHRSVLFFVQSADSAAPTANEVDSQPEVLMPLLMLLMGVMDEQPGMTQEILDLVFPPDYRSQCDQENVTVEGPAILQTSNVLGARLTKLMTTTNIALKHIVQEFLYQLCSRDANVLCTYTGVGYAAGLLQAHSLFSAQ